MAAATDHQQDEPLTAPYGRPRTGPLSRAGLHGQQHRVQAEVGPFAHGPPAPCLQDEIAHRPGVPRVLFSSIDILYSGTLLSACGPRPHSHRPSPRTGGMRRRGALFMLAVFMGCTVSPSLALAAGTWGTVVAPIVAVTNGCSFGGRGASSWSRHPPSRSTARCCER